MALGGGIWMFQNKKIPGTYINFVSKVRASVSIADRGYVLETGKIVKTGKAADLLNDDSIKKAYLGE